MMILMSRWPITEIELTETFKNVVRVHRTHTRVLDIGWDHTEPTTVLGYQARPDDSIYLVPSFSGEPTW
jgi:hypothetical protein